MSLVEANDEDLALSNKAASSVEPVRNRLLVPVTEIDDQVFDPINRESWLRRLVVGGGRPEAGEWILIALAPAPERIFGCLPQSRLCCRHVCSPSLIPTLRLLATAQEWFGEPSPPR